MCVYMHAHMYGGQKWVGVSLNHALLYSFETGSLTDLGCLASEPRESSCLYLLRT